MIFLKLYFSTLLSSQSKQGSQEGGSQGSQEQRVCQRQGQEAARRVTESIIFIYFTLFYILTSVLFRFWYNSVDMVYCRALTFSPLENELCIGSKLVVLNKNKQIKCSEIIKFTSPTTQPSDSPNPSQTWLPLSSVFESDLPYIPLLLRPLSMNWQGQQCWRQQKPELR